MKNAWLKKPELNLTTLQKRFFNFIEDNNYVICKKFRQGGFTTAALKSAERYCLNNKDSKVLYVSPSMRHNDFNKHYFLNIVKKNVIAYVRNRNGIFGFNNGSSLIFAKESDFPLRGFKVNFLIYDEAAYTRDLKSLWQSNYPMLHSNGKCLFLSGPRYNDDFFYDTYIDAVKRCNQFQIFKNNYKECGIYQDANKNKILKFNLGKEAWKQEILAEFLNRP